MDNLKKIASNLITYPTGPIEEVNKSLHDLSIDAFETGGIFVCSELSKILLKINPNTTDALEVLAVVKELVEKIKYFQS